VEHSGLRTKDSGLRIPGTTSAVPPARGGNMGNLLWLIIVILVIMWLGGFVMHIGGGLIHLLLVIAVIVLIFQLITGRRAL
ncbi:MAG: family rane protein, partial [Acidobacteria bacterium]|nr:family rane protein [Acidobacteriota bacterium]